MREGTPLTLSRWIKGQGQRHCVKILVGMIQTTVYPITFKLNIKVEDDERRNPIYFCRGVKGLCQLWQSAYEP